MPIEILRKGKEKIFDPFFTTKGPEKGPASRSLFWLSPKGLLFPVDRV